MNLNEKDAEPLVWKKYLLASGQFLLIFYAATFVVGYLFFHRGENWHLLGAAVAIIYLALVIYSLISLIRKLSMAAVLIAAPTIPLCMMILVVSLLPILQAMDKPANKNMEQMGRTNKGTA